MQTDKTLQAEKQRVTEAYNKKSQNARATDKRLKWQYMASKMLSDHYLLSKIPLEGKTVLNIGCAPHPLDEGVFAWQAGHWIASDLNPNVLGANRMLCRDDLGASVVGKMSWVAVDATDMSIADASLDVVIAMSVLEHIPGQMWRASFREIARVLKPGGAAVITMSNKLNLPYHLWSIKKQRTESEFGYEECIYPWTMKRELAEAGLNPGEFVSNFWFTPSIFMPWCRIPFLKYFGYRMGYLCRR